MVVEWEEERAQSNRVSGVTLEDVHARIESGEVAALDLIVKTDVQGSIDAIRSALEGLRTDDTRVNLIHIATGSITESDVMLAAASNAVIVGFRSEPQPGARTFASQEGVDVRYYDVIYNLIDDIEMALAGLLEPEVEDIVEGYATVRAIFQLGRGVRAAGVFVNGGRITRRAEIHVTRGGRTLFAGQIGSLKHFRDDVRELADRQRRRDRPRRLPRLPGGRRPGGPRHSAGRIAGSSLLPLTTLRGAGCRAASIVSTSSCARRSAVSWRRTSATPGSARWSAWCGSTPPPTWAARGCTSACSGDDDAKAGSMKALKSASRFVHRRLRQRVTLKSVPAVEFRLDESIEAGSDVLSLISRVRSEVPGGDS